MDSGINSMATVVVSDFIQPRRATPSTSRHDVFLARVLTLALGAASTLVAFYVSTLEGIIEAFARFMSLFNAPVLALFLLGILTRKGRFGGWCAGATAAVPATYWLQEYTDTCWVYYFPFSLFVTLGIGLVVSAVVNRVCGARSIEPGLTLWDGTPGG
jgi:SSS family solute:Na+ symporter